MVKTAQYINPSGAMIFRFSGSPVGLDALVYFVDLDPNAALGEVGGAFFGRPSAALGSQDKNLFNSFDSVRIGSRHGPEANCAWLLKVTWAKRCLVHRIYKTLEFNSSGVPPPLLPR